MTVTALIPETKGRYRVCLQGEADLVLYGKELKQFGIAEGTDLSPEQYRRILEEVLIPRARKRAMHILERMDQTTAQLRENLQRSQYPEPSITSMMNVSREILSGPTSRAEAACVSARIFRARGLTGI